MESVDLDKLSIFLRVVCLNLTHSTDVTTITQCHEAKAFIHTSNIYTYNSINMRHAGGGAVFKSQTTQFHGTECVFQIITLIKV